MRLSTPRAARSILGTVLAAGLMVSAPHAVAAASPLDPPQPAASQPAATSPTATSPAATRLDTATSAASTTAGSGPAAEPGSRFTLGVLPDTQFYSRYATPEAENLFRQRYGSEPYLTQTRWLAEHGHTLNMPFTTHLGDVVDQAAVTGEWEVADEAMDVLEDAGMNYSVLPGSHDSADRSATTPHFEQWFGADRAAQHRTFVDAHTEVDNEGQAHVFEAEGQKYLTIALAWRADAEALAWAQSVIDAHPGLPTILTAHEIMNVDSEGAVQLSEGYGEELFEDFIATNDQIFLTLSGHHHGAGVEVLRNEAGNDVVMVLQDYQLAYQGGNGLLGVLEFDLTGEELQMTALSPWVGIKPAETLTRFDELILESENDSWTVPFDFRERFTALNPQWRVGSADDPDYSARAREIVSEGYRAPEPGEATPPADAGDFPVAEGTVAHWRPGRVIVEGRPAADGEVLPVASRIPEVDAGADLFRAELNTRGARGAEEDDVVYTTSHHPLSSDGGAVCFLNPENSKDTRSWFSTAPGVAVNDEEFEDGYTLETFVYIDEEWTGDENAWMGALSRDGRREELSADMPGADESPSALAVSALRELQWTSAGLEGNVEGSSNESHEVPAGQWLHLAVVNDPQARTIEMFVDGAPILRDVIDAQGMASAGEPWILGANMWAGDPANGWLGCIGETRLTEGPLKPEEWLTARTAEVAEAAERRATGTKQDGIGAGEGSEASQESGRDAGEDAGQGSPTVDPETPDASGVAGQGASDWDLTLPVSTRITSGFGWRQTPPGTLDFFGTGGYVHQGVDFGGGCGLPVKAAAAGTVSNADAESATAGNRVVLSHGEVNGHDLVTKYHHLTHSVVSAGEQVEEGAVIGYTGSTGNSNGCHLHFETVVDGTAIDPLTLY